MHRIRIGSEETPQESEEPQDVEELIPADEEEPEQELPECPNHQASNFTQGKPRSIISLPSFINNLFESFYIVMH